MAGAPASASPLPVWQDQGRVRNWFHTRAGARFLNHQTAWFRIYSPAGYGLLTTIGRRSGARRTSAVRAIPFGERVVLVAIAGENTAWLRNALDHPQVSLRRGLRHRSGRARRPTTAESGAAKAAYCGQLTAFDFVTSVINQRGLPVPKRIHTMLERWFEEGTALVIDFDTSTRPAFGRR